MADLRILIVGDNPLARVGLSALLTGQTGLVVTGQTSSGTNLSADIELYKPDVLVWDIGWESDRLADIHESNVPVVALLNNAGQAAEAWAAGARGLVLHDADADMLTSALLAVGQGLAVFDPALAASLFTASAAPEPPAEALTAREREVLQLLAEGLPNKTIAGKLGITDHTVKFHVNAIMSKLGAQSRTEAVVRATRLGLIIL